MCPINDITYQLTIIVDAPATIQVGKLGKCDFFAGIYIYTGSAKRNIDARISRHLRREKSLRWHIDYLLHAPGVSVRKVEHFVEAECVLNQRTLGTVLMNGFGASDCMSWYGSHLKYQEK